MYSKEMMIMKHIVMFSGGASSSYLAKLVIDKYGKENTILLHTPVYAEHESADVFREKVAEYLGVEITDQAHGMSLWELIEKNNTLPSHFIPFCTTELKIKQSRKFYKKLREQGEDFTVHFGYGRDEWRRIQKQMVRLESEGIKSEYLIFDNKISNEEIKRIIRDEWKICLPEPYKYLKHNNCIPCFKGGKGHFYKVAKHYPEEFDRAMYWEEKIGHTVFKDITLREIKEHVKQNAMQVSLFDEDDDAGVPCMCAD